MYDDLWTAITEDAQRLGVSVNRYVETALYRELEKSPRKCFYCGAPGDAEVTAEVTRAYSEDTSLDDFFPEQGKAEVPEQAFTPAMLSVTVCNDHDGSLGAVLVEEYGACVGWPLSKGDYLRHPFENGGVMEEMSRMLPRGGQRGRGGAAQPDA